MWIVIGVSKLYRTYAETYVKNTKISILEAIRSTEETVTSLTDDGLVKTASEG